MASIVTREGLNYGQVRGMRIPLPPLAEQCRITAKLEALLAQVNAAKDNLTAVPPIIKRFRQSVLAAACSGRLTEDWRREHPDVEPASELLERIRDERVRKYEEERKKVKEEGGKKPKKNYEFAVEDNFSMPSWVDAKLENLIYIAGRIGWRGLKAEEYTKDGPLFLSVHNLNYGDEVDFRELNHISMERYDESPEIMLQEDDILLAKDGAGIGKIGIVKNLSQLTTVNSSLLVIRSREAFVPKYLFYFLSGPQLQSIVQQRITGSATPHLFQKDIKQFILSVPPLREQRTIVNRIETLFHRTSEVEERVAAATAHADHLTQSILAKAFRGELVPQDPDDEPASVLLERIRKERTELKKKKKPQKRRSKTLPDSN
ncbi:MAG: restriction endonuclease subunit S [Euryarchaeota archaeon]|nr:restriction endonuclease subunit S [Euryarchaeota archaeon]